MKFIHCTNNSNKKQITLIFLYSLSIEKEYDTIESPNKISNITNMKSYMVFNTGYWKRPNKLVLIKNNAYIKTGNTEPIPWEL